MSLLISRLFKRLFNSLVLVSFLWMTLFPTLAWATEKSPDAVFKEQNDNSSFYRKSKPYLGDSHTIQPEDDYDPTLDINKKNSLIWQTFLTTIINQSTKNESFSFGIGIDTRDDLVSFAKNSALEANTNISHRFDLPTNFSFTTNQDYFKSSTAIQQHYQGFSLTTGGLTWQAHGYDFMLDFSGDVRRA